MLSVFLFVSKNGSESWGGELKKRQDYCQNHDLDDPCNSEKLPGKSADLPIYTIMSILPRWSWPYLLVIPACIMLLQLRPLAAERTEIIYAFRNFQDPRPERMILVGEIQSKTKMPEVYQESSPFRGYDTRRDQITVKVVNRRGLKVGQKLYVIDKDPFHSRYRDGLIVGEIEVQSILHNSFYGWVLTGSGILLRVREGQFVARTLETENLERAYILKKRGDHYAQRGNIERAINSYHDALEADLTLPEANAALGDIYLGMSISSDGREVPVRALDVYRRAWDNRVNFRYRYEEFQFYRNYMEALYFTYDLRSKEASREENLAKYLDQIILVAQEALKLNNDAWVLTRLARAHYLRMVYFKLQASVEERASFDESFSRAGQILKQLIDAEYEDAELFRIAILFYGHVYDRNRNLDTEDAQELRAALATRIRQLYRRYTIYSAESIIDPDTIRVLNTIPEGN
ncbi:MAG: hypothetical protein KDK30_15795 [Leptospiraceae bacterium]|nr:hypothetical protein [Leptospiraceae bacterium]